MCVLRFQISLCIYAVQSVLVVCIKLASLAIQNGPGEDSDQTARMRRLIRIFAWRTYSKVRFVTLHLKNVYKYSRW